MQKDLKVHMTNLKRIREESGISQAKLAEMSGTSPRMIPKYETRKKDINNAHAMTVFKIAKSLGVSVEDLLEEEEQ